MHANVDAILDEVLSLMKISRHNLRAAIAAQNLSIQHIQRLRRLRSATAAWTPADLAVGAYAWYDAQDADTVTELAGAVSQWADKSGNARHFLQASAPSQPTYTAAAINGEPAITIGPGFMHTTSFGGLSGDDITIFIVLQLTSPVGFSNRILGLGTAVPGSDWGSTEGCLLSGGNDTELHLEANGNRGGAIPHVAGTPQIVAGIADGTDWVNWVNGASTGTSTYTPAFGVTHAGLGIGSPGNGTPQAGECGELIILDYDAGTSDRQRIEGYLAWKWGLEADLPGGHPYENAPPTL